MPVQGANLTSIEAKRFSKAGERHGQVRIDHNSTVTLVKAMDDSHASVEFRYTASYGSLGIIKLEGALQWQGDDAPGLADQWAKTNQMPQEVASDIHSTVMRVCVPHAVGISKDLNLPPPIPLPQVKFQQQGQQRDAGHGPEVA